MKKRETTTPEVARQLLTSALAYVQEAGYEVRAVVIDGALYIVVPGMTLEDAPAGEKIVEVNPE